MASSPFATLPLIRTGKYGLRGDVTTGLGKAPPFHSGVDVRAARGTTFRAVEAGTVIGTRTNWASADRPGSFAGSSLGGQVAGAGGGNIVIVQVATTLAWVYAHLQTVAVKVGQQVGTATTLGVTGVTGGISAAHLHLGLFQLVAGRWQHIDPTLRLPWAGDVFDDLETITATQAPTDQRPPTVEARPAEKEDDMYDAAARVELHRKIENEARPIALYKHGTGLVAVDLDSGNRWNLPNDDYRKLLQAIGLAGEIRGSKTLSVAELSFVERILGDGLSSSKSGATAKVDELLTLSKEQAKDLAAALEADTPQIVLTDAQLGQVVEAARSGAADAVKNLSFVAVVGD